MLRWRELTFVFLLSILVAAQGVNSSSFFDGGYKVMTYWGQNSANGAGTQKNLASYCDDSSDVLIMSFITEFNVGGLPTLNLASACEKTYFDGTNLLKCPQVANDIKTCQGQGKKVLLSLGGASGSYGFSNDGDGQKFAQTLWDLFLGGNSSTRPFGDVAIDGFDLDIEAGGSTGYVAFIEKLRQLFESDSSKEYYITAAPQCPFPDAMLGSVIDNANVDALNVQFYNNFCSVSSSSFNFDQWADWAKTKSPNKDVKIFLGVPGSSSAAGSGFTPASQLQSVIEKLKSSDASVFGGVTVWDASQSYSSDFASAIAGDVHGGSSPSSSSKKSRKNKNKSKRWRLFDQLRR